MTASIASRLIGIAALFVFLAAPARAEWREASSEHFVIYSDSREDDLRDFGETLERYHRAMELMTGRSVETPSPSNRLVIYAVGSDTNLKKLYGNRDSNVAGFYIPRAAGSRAFVPNIKIGSGEPDFSLTVLLHEYAHHFLISTSRHAMPRWLSEGSAEFFASARFLNDGTVQIGLPNNSRAWEISQASEVSLAELLDYDLYRQRRSNRYDSYYGRSWLLVHYLTFDEARAGQLTAYWRAIRGGIDSVTAAQEAFGDLETLSGELKSYGRQRRMSGMAFTAKELPIGPVTVTSLSDGMAAMMPVIQRSQRGVDDEEAAEVIADAREIAARYPADPGVQAALAEAEYDAGNDDAAVAAADRAIAADAETKKAYVHKGYALFRKAYAVKDTGNSGDTDAAFTAAMQPFQKLNALEADHTGPLIYFYRSYRARGLSSPESARHALERASQLAPFDHSLAMDAAVMLAGEGKVKIAANMLGPVAANPHGGRRAKLANALIERLGESADGEPFDASAAMDAFTEEDGDGEEQD